MKHLFLAFLIALPPASAIAEAAGSGQPVNTTVEMLFRMTIAGRLVWMDVQRGDRRITLSFRL